MPRRSCPCPPRRPSERAEVWCSRRAIEGNGRMPRLSRGLLAVVLLAAALWLGAASGAWALGKSPPATPSPPAASPPPAAAPAPDKKAPAAEPAPSAPIAGAIAAPDIPLEADQLITTLREI